MKKIYAMMALALGAGLSAQAIKPVSGYTCPQNAEVSPLIQNVETVNGAQKVAKAPSKISQVSDLFGEYSASYTWMLNGNNIDAMSPVIEAGSTANEVTILGFPWTDIPVTAIVDVEKSTLTINRQEAYYHTNYNETVYIVFQDLREEGTVFVNQVVADITPEGNIVFPPYIGICYYLYEQQGYMWAWYNCVLTRVKAWEFNASEWTSAGIVQFKDTWLASAFEDGDEWPFVEVEMMKSNKNNGDLLLVNPYQADFLSNVCQEMGGYAGTGYIRFNISYPDCVYVYPLVGSGAYADLFNDGKPVQLFNYNLEGQYVFNGYTPEETYDVLDFKFIYPSWYEDGDVTLCNYYFGITGAMMTSYNWVGDNNERSESLGEIMWDPEAANVGGIISENNEPVKYFNLQGVEVVNPEKGQLVIKTQGTKTSKHIVR